MLTEGSKSTQKVLKIAQKISVHYGEMVKEAFTCQTKDKSIYMLIRGQQEL